MLVRRLKRGDSLKVGSATIKVRKSTEDNLEVAIEAPASVRIRHEKGDPPPA